jgi:hypothetical protein
MSESYRTSTAAAANGEREPVKQRFPVIRVQRAAADGVVRSAGKSNVIWSCGGGDGAGWAGVPPAGADDGWGAASDCALR